MNQGIQQAGPPPAVFAALSPEEMLRMLQELQVRQIELETENKELRRPHAYPIDTQARYTELYDQAPVGYFTLSGSGRILEANLTAATLLGIARDELVTQPVSRFIDHEYRDSFHLHCKQLFETGTPQKCELRMVQNDGTPFWAHHAAKVACNAGGVPVCRVVLTDITGRKQIETALRIKSLVFYEAISANSIADLNGIITESNTAFLRIWGYAHVNEVIGKPIPHFFNDLNEATAILTALNETGHWEGEFSAKRKDGSTFIASSLATVVRDENDQLIGYQSAVMDITGRKQAEQILREWNHTLEQRVAERTMELQQSEDRLRQLTHATFEGIAIIENELLLEGNSQLGDMFGYELAEMIGRPIENFIVPELRAMVARYVRDDHEITYEFVGLRKDGSTFPGEAHARMSQWQNKKTRISALRDLTTVKQTAASLQAQQTELEQAQRLSLISEICVGIIHQISQPLCAIGANVTAALVRLNACELKSCGSHEIIQDVASDVARMREAVIHLKSLAHPEKSIREPLDLNALVASVRRLLQQEAEHRQFSLVIKSAKELPLVLANAVQLSQVIFNLVRNAFDACADCPPERRHITIATRKVAGADAELSVCDAGTGIPPAAMDRLFAPFFTTKPDGLGIGLRLSRTIAEVHDGTLKGSNNSDGVGATFRMVLPGNPASRDAKV